MENKLLHFVKAYDMIHAGDSVTCAVSGGADSMALLFAMYLLAPKLGIRLSAAHFNHHLRGAESDRDAAFVREFCAGYHIPLLTGEKNVSAGKKGLEAAAREARYAFFDTLPGKIATAHTANDNAETVLMHMVRGTGLKGLGAIAPVRGNLIRPMLSVTRDEVMAFLEEYHIPYVEDSSNHGDDFLRNRLRHYVMPLLKQENPRFAENMSAMALRLREDEAVLQKLSDEDNHTDIYELRQMPDAYRTRQLTAFLKSCGVREPEAEHIRLAESLVFSEKPSARASLPNGVVICRNYDRLELCPEISPLETHILACPGITEVPQLGLRVICEVAEEEQNIKDGFLVKPQGSLILRHRCSGDEMRLSGGTKSLKKIFIDRKIPAAERLQIPVIADDCGVIGVYGIGVNMDRQETSGYRIRFETI